MNRNAAALGVFAVLAVLFVALVWLGVSYLRPSATPPRPAPVDQIISTRTSIAVESDGSLRVREEWVCRVAVPETRRYVALVVPNVPFNWTAGDSQAGAPALAVSDVRAHRVGLSGPAPAAWTRDFQAPVLDLDSASGVRTVRIGDADGPYLPAESFSFRLEYRLSAAVEARDGVQTPDASFSGAREGVVWRLPSAGHLVPGAERLDIVLPEDAAPSRVNVAFLSAESWHDRVELQSSHGLEFLSGGAPPALEDDPTPCAAPVRIFAPQSGRAARVRLCFDPIDREKRPIAVRVDWPQGIVTRHWNRMQAPAAGGTVTVR